MLRLGRILGHNLIVSESKLHLAMIYFYTGQKDTAVKYLGQYLQMWTCESMKKTCFTCSQDHDTEFFTGKKMLKCPVCGVAR